MTDAKITPLWLSHHYPGQYDRCVVVGRRHLCRRCAVMYPFAVLVGVIALLGFELSVALVAGRPDRAADPCSGGVRR